MTFSFLKHCTKDDLKLSIYDSIHLVNTEHWNTLVENRNIFLSLPYLSALEDSKPKGVDFRYVVFYDDHLNPIGVAVLQILDIQEKNLRNQTYTDEVCHVKYKLLNSLQIQALICGNIFATGEHGWLFVDTISKEQACDFLDHALQKLAKAEKSKDKSSVLLLKEFWPDQKTESQSLQKHGFKEFQIDVNMRLSIDPHWHSMEDYMESMVTKFRTKVKSVYKKSEVLKSQVFSAQDTQKQAKRMQELYMNVAEKADFNLGSLNASFFVQLKKNLKENTLIRGYFLDDELIGFSLCMLNNKALEALYVGIDYQYNTTHALYQRMLLDMVEYALEQGLSEIRFGRTAEEVKSCLGCVPVPMNLYVKHRNVISNQILKTLINNIKPRPFELRNPFKAEYLDKLQVTSRKLPTYAEASEGRQVSGGY